MKNMGKALKYIALSFCMAVLVWCSFGGMKHLLAKETTNWGLSYIAYVESSPNGYVHSWRTSKYLGAKLGYGFAVSLWNCTVYYVPFRTHPAYPPRSFGEPRIADPEWRGANRYVFFWLFTVVFVALRSLAHLSDLEEASRPKEKVMPVSHGFPQAQGPQRYGLTEAEVLRYLDTILGNDPRTHLPPRE